MKKKLIMACTHCLLFLLISSSIMAQFRVVGYLPVWNGYPNNINNMQLNKLTDINIAFGNPDANGNITGVGTTADVAIVVNACHAKNVKVILSLGGANGPANTYKSLITNDQTAFINKIVQFAVNNNLDGVDIDFESGILKPTVLSVVQYESFMTQLGTALHALGKILTIATSVNSYLGNYVTNNTINILDQISIMSYDSTGFWSSAGQHSSYPYMLSGFQYWNSTRGVAASKLNLGVPFYGWGWGTYANGSNTNSYCNIINKYPGAENKDQVGSGNNVIYYNGLPTMRKKAQYAVQNAGGIMIWEMTMDCNNSKSLLNVIDSTIKSKTPFCAFQTLPGMVQAENYCSMAGVQTETTTDAGGGSNVAFINQNDYMDYPVNVTTAGNYTITYRVASQVSGAQFELRNGATVLNTVTVPNTGGWQIWQTVTATVNLSAGSQTIRIYSTQTPGWNINWFEVKSNAAVASVSIALTSGSNPSCSGSSLTFTATPINGGTTPAYQWKVNEINVGTNSPSYTTTSITNGQNVTCVMTSNLASVSGSPATSNAITINITTVSVPAISIALTTGSNPTCFGTALTFTATPTNGGTTPSYQWKVSGINAGTNSATFTTSTLTNGQTVSCVLTSNANCASPATATSTSITITVNSIASLPGIIQAESYCSMFGIQTETTTDVGGGLNVGYIQQGDYMDYPVNVTTAGNYTITYRVASQVSGAQFELRNGATVLNTVIVPNTGGWQTWQTVTAPVNLSAGSQTLRIYSTQTAGWNINWFEVKSITTAIAKEEKLNYINVYPNPFIENFTLIISPTTTIKDAVMKIYDVCGKEVRAVSISSNETIIDRNELQNGIYFYQVIIDNKNIAKGKLVVQN